MIDELAIFRNLGIYADVGQKFTSPFRPDDNPGCMLKMWNNYLRFYDGADKIRNGKGAVALYGIQHDIPFEDALIEIKSNRLFKPISFDNSIKTERTIPKKVIEPIKRKWNKEGLLFWSKRGVTPDERLAMVKGFWVKTDTEHYYIDKSKELGFIYYYHTGEWKMYFPNSKDKKFKFLSGVRSKVCMYYDCGSDKLLTLKANKDYLEVEAIVKRYELPINLNHLQTERIPNRLLSIPNVNIYKSYREHHIIMDNDVTGIEGAETMKELLGTIPHFVSIGKDVDDYLLATDELTVLNWLKEILKL